MPGLRGEEQFGNSAGIHGRKSACWGTIYMNRLRSRAVACVVFSGGNDGKNYTLPLARAVQACGERHESA